MALLVSHLIRPKKSATIRLRLRVWETKIFDNSAFGYWLLAFGQKDQSNRNDDLATLCRPDRKNGKIRLKLGKIGRLKNMKKRLRQPFDCLIELGFGFCFQQSSMVGGVGG